MIAEIAAAVPLSGWARVHCPFCPEKLGKTDTGHAMSVSSRGYYECHRCGTSGWATKRSAPVASIAPAPAPPKCALPDGALSLASRAPALNAAKRYLISRLGTSAGIAVKRADLHATPMRGKYRSRIVAPLRKHGELIGWIARDYSGDGKPKYVNSKGMPRELWNGDVIDDKPPFLLVVEGVFDALRYLPYAVACLGKPSRAQKNRLLSADCPIIVALDADVSGSCLYRPSSTIGARCVGEQLTFWLKAHGKQAAQVLMPPTMDPGSCGIDWMRERIKTALCACH